MASPRNKGPQEDLCEEENENVRVYVRIRPFNSAEIAASAEAGEKLRSVVMPNGPRVALLNPKEGYAEMDAMTFDDTFWSIPAEQQPHKSAVFATQEYVYNQAGGPILRNAFDGYNSCIFAYGQTGSGKTHTMMGYGADPGLIPRLCHALFDRIKEEQVIYPNRKFEVVVTFFEIYNEKVKDLFAKHSGGDDYKGLKVRNHPIDGPFVEGLEPKTVLSAVECIKWIERGGMNRTTKQTGMNDTSSRSHAIFKIRFTQTETEYDEEGNPVPLNRVAQLNLVDLAGSERIKKSKVGGDSDKLLEATNINQSLTTLRKVIDALIDAAKGKKTVPPYRESMLTWVLSESLGGNSKTVMVAAVSPHSNNTEETLGTLRYALRAKSIVNKVRANESKSSKLLREMRDNMARMQAMVASGEAGPNVEIMRAKMEAEIEERQRQIKEINARAESSAKEKLEMEKQLEAIKEQEARTQEEDKAVELEKNIAEETYLTERQRAFSSAFRNAYQIKITKRQYDQEVKVYKTKQADYQKQFNDSEEKALKVRRHRDDLRLSINALRKEIKQQEYKLSQVTDQFNDFTRRVEDHEAEAAIAAAKLKSHNEDTAASIARLEASVKTALHDREVATDLLNKRQAEGRRAKQVQDMELLNAHSKYEVQTRELQQHVESLEQQEDRLSQTIAQLTETLANYESQVKSMYAAVDAQEKELEHSKNETRHKRLADQRSLREIVLEIEVERDAYKELMLEGKGLVDKLKSVEDRAIQSQRYTLYRGGSGAVKAWLSHQSLEEYIPAFEKTGITDLSLAMKVDAILLRSMKVLPGHARKYLAGLEDLQERLEGDPSITESPVLMQELLRSLYVWQEEVSFSVNGATTATKGTSSSSPSAYHGGDASSGQPKRTPLFGQQKGDDGLWHSPKVNTHSASQQRSLSPASRGLQVVQENVIHMMNFSDYT